MTTFKKLTAITIMLVGMFQMTSCKGNDTNYTDEMYLKSNYKESVDYYSYYNPSPIFSEAHNINDEDIDCNPKGEKLKEDQIQKVSKIFENITNYYGIEKEMPEIRVVTEEEMNSETGSINVTGKYFRDMNVIYIVEDFEEATVAHEMVHYLSGEGLIYVSNGMQFGRLFDEGVTNYLSTRIYEFPEEGYCVYELETHQAEMLASIIGEDKLAEAYFSGDITILRDEFNATLRDIYENEIVEGVELTPFDVYVGCIDAYFMFLSNIEYDTEVIIDYISMEADTIESMMMMYGRQKGKESELKELVKNLIANEEMIAWSYYTSFSEMVL